MLGLQVGCALAGFAGLVRVGVGSSTARAVLPQLFQRAFAIKLGRGQDACVGLVPLAPSLAPSARAVVVVFMVGALGAGAVRVY
ncbi:hypothetical protein A5746_00925 [Mycolicibacterium conceptionense]|nr:hypothetical protein A5746_00925 [Mycolicibacterium conceptionense]